ncbi:helix-turn-helix domain-containing protein [Streptomyces sp. NPDC005784]|uniref:helix-turn-helix domain-containing protein n=1 Tax=Streptomyces sp. NPDC005784 TaxID=3364731 RepID=UPI0036A822D5
MQGNFSRAGQPGEDDTTVDRIRRALYPAVLPRAVHQMGEGERELLLDTLDVWFGCGGSAEEAAKRLYVHPNTVRMRLRRIAERTGRSLADPRGITELSLALRAVRQTAKPPSS